MDKVGFFRSIHVKFVLIYVLLILIAMQVISVYFINNLEDNLKENYISALKNNLDFFEFNAEQKILDAQQMKETTEDGNSNTLTTDIAQLINETKDENIKSVLVLNKDGWSLAPTAKI